MVFEANKYDINIYNIRLCMFVRVFVVYGHNSHTQQRFGVC